VPPRRAGLYQYKARVLPLNVGNYCNKQKKVCAAECSRKVRRSALIRRLKYTFYKIEPPGLHLYRLMDFKKAFFQRTRAAFAHRAGRLATFGLAGVLIVLSIFALWGEFSTNRAANAAKRSSELSDAFEQARFAVAAEESLNRKYRLQPSPEVLGKHREAAASLSAAMERAQGLGDPADRTLISDVLAIHKEYLLAIDRMFAAVDAGDITRANELDRTDVDPKFDVMEAQVFAASPSSWRSTTGRGGHAQTCKAES
jgi:CHASE3 domain sensor protein